MNRIIAALRGIEVEAFLLEPAITVQNVGNFIEWYKKKGGQITDLALPYSPTDYEKSDSDLWLNYIQHLAFQKSIIDKVEGFALPMYFDMGYAGTMNKMLANYKVIVSFLSQEGLLRKFAAIAKTFQSYVDLSVLESRPGYCKFRYDIDPLFNRYMLGGAAHNITGLLCAGLSLRFGVECSYTILRNQALLENVINAAYERYSLVFLEQNNTIYIDGEEIGTRTQTESGPGAGPISIKKDLCRDGARLLEAGNIFDAPYCEIEISWERKLPIRKRIEYWRDRSIARKRSSDELEASLKKAQANYHDATKAKNEALRLSRELAEKNSALEGLAENLENKVKERTASLNAALEKLRHMDVIRSNLLATVSHELRTPITLIKGPLERMLRGKYGETIRTDNAIFAGMALQAERLVRVLDGVLEFTQLEFEKNSMTMRPVNIGALAKNVVEEFLLEASLANIRLSCHTADSDGAFVDGEPSLIKTAIANLISNAIKFTSPSGVVELRVETENSSVHISVRDTGIGIEKELQATIFDRFHRISRDPEPKLGGAGLGLYLVREIIHMHGGEIRLESERHKGSQFTIELPRAEIESPGLVKEGVERLGPMPEPRKTSAHDDPSWSNRDAPSHSPHGRILVVEDNRDLAEFLKQGLGARYEITIAGDGIEAIEILKQGPAFDLVLSDIMMPLLDGLGLFSQARFLDEKRPPFLFLTAKSDDSTKLSALDEGAIDFIVKPFDELELERKIDNIIRLCRNSAKISNSPDPAILEASARKILENSGLSAREIGVALLLVRGKSKKEIASELTIAIATAKRHIENIYSKIGVGDRFQLFAKIYPTEQFH